MGEYTLDKRLERILPRVQKPARYTGGEYNAVKKDPAQVDTRIAFCFPDTYEIGMSNLGMRILYGVMNNMDGVWCQRVFAPWGDMEEEMRKAQIPLFALESGEALHRWCWNLSFSFHYQGESANFPRQFLRLHRPNHCSLQTMGIARNHRWFNQRITGIFRDERIGKVARQETP